MTNKYQMQTTFKILDTSKPLEFLEYVGRVAHNSEIKGEPEKFLNKLLESGHYSVFEHLWITERHHTGCAVNDGDIKFINPFCWQMCNNDYCYTFSNARQHIDEGKNINEAMELYREGLQYEIDNPWFKFASVEIECSIACVRQFMRHRWPWAYMEKSLRHVKPSKVIYPDLSYAEHLQTSINTEIDVCIENYNSYVKGGAHKEDARMILPLATATRFIATAPLCGWNNLFSQRAVRTKGNHPQQEIYDLTNAIMNELQSIYGDKLIHPEALSFGSF